TVLHACATERSADVVKATTTILEDCSNREHMLAAARIMQLALGDVGEPRHKGTVWEGYTPRKGDGKARETLGMRLWMHVSMGLWGAWMEAEKQGWTDSLREIG